MVDSANEQERRVELAREVLGERFTPMHVAVVAQKLFPGDYPDPKEWAVEVEKINELHNKAGRALGLLAYEGYAIKIGAGLWARNTSKSDWRSWLSVMLDELVDGSDESLCQLAMNGLQGWGRHVGRIGGSAEDDWESVGTKAIEILCRPEGLREPKGQTQIILSKAVRAIWRLKTAETMLSYMKGVQDEMMLEQDRSYVGYLVNNLERYSRSMAGKSS